MAIKPNSARVNERQHAPTDLHLAGALPSDEALRVIIDEWLIPAMLDEFLRTKILRPGVEQGHSGSEPNP